MYTKDIGEMKLCSGRVRMMIVGRLIISGCIERLPYDLFSWVNFYFMGVLIYGNAIVPKCAYFLLSLAKSDICHGNDDLTEYWARQFMQGGFQFIMWD